MTVKISKPAVNLREELASLRNQGGYEEQKFYFDGLVTNGDFSTSDLSDWSASSSNVALAVVSGQLNVVNSGSGYGYASYSVTSGLTYIMKVDWIQKEGQGRMFVGNTFGSNNYFQLTAAGTHTQTFTATSDTLHIKIFDGYGGSATNIFDNISVYETDGTDVIHTIPKGWKPKDVYENGLLQREGSAHDYEVIYDGFDYVVKPTVAPSATTQTCVIGVKA